MTQRSIEHFADSLRRFHPISSRRRRTLERLADKVLARDGFFQKPDEELVAAQAAQWAWDHRAFIDMKRVAS